MKRLLLLFLIPSLAFGQSVTVNQNNLPVSTTNPFSILTTSSKNGNGVPYADITGQQPTYITSVTFTPITGVMYAFCGSATKAIAVRSFSFGGIATTAGTMQFNIIKTSTAPTGGTSTAATPVPLDSTNAASTGSIRAYSVAPTGGTSVGNLLTYFLYLPDTSAANAESQIPRAVVDAPGGSPLILRGTSQCVEIQSPSTPPAGAQIYVDFMWTETSTFPW